MNLLLRFSDFALVLAASMLLLACGSDSSTTPAPAPAPAPPPPPAPEPAEVAGDWLLVHESAGASIEAAMPADEDCLVDWWNQGSSESTASQRDLILRIEQTDEALLTHEWGQPREASAENPWPPDLESAHPTARSAGTVDLNDVTMMQTHAWGGGEEGWVPYPIAYVERPTERIRGLTEMCPEYSGQILQVTQMGTERSMAIQDDGTMTGTSEEGLHWRVGDRTWIVTYGPFPLMASPLEPPS